MSGDGPSLPRAISTGRARAGAAAADEAGDPHHAIAIPGSVPHQSLTTAWYSSTPPITISSSRGADPDSSLAPASLPRSLAWGGGSFIAGHSAFARSSSMARSPASSRLSLDNTPHAVYQQQQQSAGGPYLGLEPGLGLTAPLLDQHHRRGTTAAAAAGGSYAGTPTSTAASDTDTFGRGLPSPPPAARTGTGAVSASAAAAAAEAAAGIAAAGASSARAAAAAAGGGGSGGKRRVDAGQLRNSVLYGIINAVVGIPTMISFAAIVWQDPLYKPLLGQLARVSFFSAAVHQLVFTLFSTLPFAVGQPQDVGLIFLSAMATGVAEIGQSKGMEDAEIVGTAMLTLTVATTLVGILTWLVARFKLATLVQYVPLPVVGGYLGYVGYFCLAAGIGLGTNTTIDTLTSWAALASTDALIKLVPTLAAGLALWVCMTRAHSPWALPLTLAAVPAAFHAYLLLSGTSLAQAQDAGWVLKPEGKSTQQFWELYELFHIQDWHLDGIDFPAMARQVPKMLGLFFVVTFGSCLDVAAIQADMPFPIDFNSELGTVGLSNMIVGLSGSGYTGSYIFSQTIFSMRAGVTHWSHGAIITALEAAIFLLPFSVVQYLPNFFFGALLTVFGIEIAGDWLVRSYAKVSTAEYLLLLATFLSILQLELEKGVAAGILLCTLYFAVTYARANLAAVKVLPTRSAAVRSYAESHLLEALAGRLATVALSGFIFFGSSVLMSDKVIALAQDMADPNKAQSKQQAAAAGGSADGQTTFAASPTAAAAGVKGSGASQLSDLRIASLAVQGSGPLRAPDDGQPKGVDAERLAALERNAPAFIILDFRRVLGVDATSAQTLASLAMVCRRMDVEIIITRIPKHSIRRLLAAHGIISPADAAAAGGGSGDQQQQQDQDPELQEPLLQQEPAAAGEGQHGHGSSGGGSCCRVFETLSAAARYAEDRLLELAEGYGILQEPLTGLTLQQFLAMHCQQALLTRSVDVGAVTAEVAKLAAVREVGAGQRLFGYGEPPDSFFLILKGVVTIQVKSLSLPHHSTRPLPAQLDVMEVERSFSSGQGAVVGVTDFVLRRLRSFSGVAATPVTVVEVSREALERMVVEVPEVATALQAVLLRDACLSEVYAYEVLERAAAA